MRPSPNQIPLFDLVTFKPFEIWKEIPGFDGRYEASDQGRIRRVKEKLNSKASWREPIMKPTPDSGGYLRIGLMCEGELIRRGVHQFIAMAFLGSCPDGYEVNHIDRDKTNNRLSNLEYLSHAENIHHARAVGVPWNTPRGERGGQSKLTNEQAAEIRASRLSQRQLSKLLNVSQVTIHNIKSGKTYRRYLEDCV